MLEVDLIVEPSVSASISAATDRHLMKAVGEGRRPVLRVSEVPGRVLSLGRYHLAPKPVADSGVEVTRRVCGGRVWPAGAGYRTVSLALPQRSALVGNDPYTLAPFQVLNRFVRGHLQACREMGIPAYYPGRDLITVDRSVLAMVSFECGAGGSTLLEAHLATSSDLGAVADLLDAADPEGDVTVELWAPGATTSLEQRLGRVVDVEEMAAMLCRGYESQFPITFRAATLSGAETGAIRADAESATADWIAARQRHSSLDRHVASRVQVGVLEAYFSVDTKYCIDSILFAGDFIANSPAVETLERRLHGCALQVDAIDRVVHEVFGDKENFILGVGKLEAISRLLAGDGNL